MEAVKSVRHSIMANSRAVSKKLTDAYSCSDTSEILKIPSVCLRTSDHSVQGLTVWNVPKPADFHKLMSVITAQLRLCVPYLSSHT